MNSNIKKKTNLVKLKKNKTNLIKLNKFPGLNILFHVYNIKVFNDILHQYPKFFNNSDNKIFISTIEENKEFIKRKLPKSKILIVENRGADIGGILSLVNNFEFNDSNLFLFLHTKSCPLWRKGLIDPLYDLYKTKKIVKYDNLTPLIIGSQKYIYENNQQVNYEIIREIVKKYFGQDISDYIDEEYNLDKSFFDINKNFYKSYYNDLESVKDQENHFKLYGINEGRINNPNFLKKIRLKTHNFIAGTIFYANSYFIKILKKINLKKEISLMEQGYVINNIPRRTHSFEYLYGLLCDLFGGRIVDTYNFPPNKSIIVKQCVLNNLSDTPICISLLAPDGFGGGYRTLLKYINVINKKLNKHVDIYIGTNLQAPPYEKNGIIKLSIEKIIEDMKKYDEFDVDKNNIFLGLKIQKKYQYKLAIVGANQSVIDFIKINENKIKNVLYVIQDREELFYDDPKLKKHVLNTYHPNFNYYCLSKYLTDYFSKNYKLKKIYQSCLSYDSNIYFNKNEIRENCVLIAYYPFKKNRLIKLVDKIIDILIAKNINVITYPYSTKKKSNYLKEFGTMTPYELNNLYNKFKVGIIFSNSNPSRIGLEMVASGLNVIEYKCDFTEKDLIGPGFTLIKSANNIDSIVINLFNKEPPKNNLIKTLNHELNYFYDALEGSFNN